MVCGIKNNLVPVFFFFFLVYGGRIGKSRNHSILIAKTPLSINLTSLLIKTLSTALLLDFVLTRAPLNLHG